MIVSFYLLTRESGLLLISIGDIYNKND